MDVGVATLIAAIIAAISSLFTLFSDRKSEIRQANRNTLELYVTELSESIYQIVATSNILLKNKSQESRDNWTERAEVSKQNLKDLRPKVRYILWGVDDSIQTLTRLPDFTLYTLSDSNVSKKVVTRGTRLGNNIDKCIRNCYLNGRAPNQYEILKIKFLSWHFRQARDKYRENKINR